MSLVIVGLVALFFATIVSGPACADWRERRRRKRAELEDAPVARVVYLPTNACRERDRATHHREAGCAIVGYCELCDDDLPPT